MIMRVSVCMSVSAIIPLLDYLLLVPRQLQLTINTRIDKYNFGNDNVAVYGLRLGFMISG